MVMYYFCTNDWGKEIKVGNLVNQTLEEVWLGEKMYEIRKEVNDRTA